MEKPGEIAITGYLTMAYWQTIAYLACRTHKLLRANLVSF